MKKKSVQKTTVLGITISTTLNSMMKDTAKLPGELMGKAAELMPENDIPQIWIYDGADSNMDKPIKLTMSIPVEKNSVDHGKFSFYELPEFNCISELHHGPWDKLGETYQKLMPAIAQQGFTYTGMAREIYSVVDFENPENCVTEIQVEVK
ncbi:MAG: GyrI-like domain-containing protein [Prolixibacteraceae bacterium]|jgi:effector-binding domain-containing protein